MAQLVRLRVAVLARSGECLAGGRGSAEDGDGGEDGSEEPDGALRREAFMGCSE
jgi:hypothetical protein